MLKHWIHQGNLTNSSIISGAFGENYRCQWMDSLSCGLFKYGKAIFLDRICVSVANLLAAILLYNASSQHLMRRVFYINTILEQLLFDRDKSESYVIIDKTRAAYEECKYKKNVAEVIVTKNVVHQ